MSAGLRPYPEYRESGVAWLGSVPAHWEMKRCRYLFREVDARSSTGTETHLSMSQQHGLVPRTQVEDHRLVSESYVGGKLCEPDDLVLNRLKAHLGVFARASEPGLVSPDYTVLRRIGSTTMTPYFELVLRSPECRGELRTRTKGLVEGFWRLYTDDLYSVVLPCPPADEQRAIVRYLDAADRRIRRYVRAKQRLIALLEEQKRLVVHRAVTRGLDPDAPRKPSGVEWLGEVPAHWDVRKIGQCGMVVGGMTPSMDVREFWDGRVPWVTPKDMKRTPISDSIIRVTPAAIAQTSLRELPAPAVLLVVRGMVLARRVPVAWTDAPVTVNQDMKALLPVADVHAEFLARVVEVAQDPLALLIDESGHGTKRLPWERVRALPIPLPPRDEQVAIAEYVRTVTNDAAGTRSVVEREVALLREYRTRLVADVVTGKLDVRAAAAQLSNDPGEPDAPPLDDPDTPDEDAAEDAPDLEPAEA